MDRLAAAKGEFCEVSAVCTAVQTIFQPLGINVREHLSILNGIALKPVMCSFMLSSMPMLLCDCQSFIKVSYLLTYLLTYHISTVSDLGVLIDIHLSMSDSVESLCRACFFQLRQLRQVIVKIRH